MSVSLPDLIRAIRGMIPTEKCNLLEELVQKLQRREVRLNRQEFLHKVRDIAGDDAPAKIQLHPPTVRNLPSKWAVPAIDYLIPHQVDPTPLAVRLDF